MDLADLNEQLASPDPSTRRAAIDAATHLGDPRAVTSLMAVLSRDPDPSLRALALQAMLHLQPDLAADAGFMQMATSRIQEAGQAAAAASTSAAAPAPQDPQGPPGPQSPWSGGAPATGANPWSQPGGGAPNPLPPSPPRPSPGGDKVYEMLWDCKFCGQKKLLGKTHRHCPSCGAAQDPSARYFPSDAEKVAVQDHEFVGADRLCGFCKAPNAAKAKCCTECGAPLDDRQVKGVFLRGDQVGEGFAGETAADARREREHGAQPAKPAKKGGFRWWHGLLLAVGALFAFLLIGTFWTHTGGYVVRGHRWQRVVHVEAYGPQQDSSWCDNLPGAAYAVRHAREVRSHNRVPDGQDCRTRRHDNGDGTFSERRECTTKYREEPVYGDKCYYTIDRWHPEREARAEGGIADTVRWPDANLRGGGLGRVGAEREGGRDEKYTVTLVDEKKGKAHDCDFDAAKWQAMGEGSRWVGSSGVILGDLRCDSLAPAR